MTVEELCNQRKTIELIRLPNIDNTNVRSNRFTIADAIKPLMEDGKYYVVSVDTSYVSGRQGNVRQKTTHYIAKKHTHTDGFESVQMSSYPTYAFDEPERFFK